MKSNLKSNISASAGFSRFNENSFFNTILGFCPKWDYKPNFEFFSKNELKVTSIKKVHLKSDCVDGSKINSFREPIPYSFFLDKSARFKIVS